MRNLGVTRQTRGYLSILILVCFVVGCRSYPWSPESVAQGPLEGQPRSTLASGGETKTAQAASKKGSKAQAEEEAEYARKLAQGRSLERLGKLDEARKTYEGLIARFPTRYEAYHRLAVVSDRQMRYAEAEALYTQAIRLNPTNPDLFNDLGYCYLLQGKPEKAERALLKAVGIAPASERYRNNLGLAYGLQGRYEEAMEQFRRANGEADAWYNLAYVQWMRNDVELSKQSLENALAYNPSHSAARESLAQLASGHSFFAESTAERRAGYRLAPDTESQLNAADSAPSSSAQYVTQTTFEAVPGTLRLGLKDRPSTQTQLDVARSSWARRLQQETVPLELAE